MAEKSMILDKEIKDALSWIQREFKEKGEFEISYEEREYLISKADEVIESPGSHILLKYRKWSKKVVSVDIRNGYFSYFIRSFYVNIKRK